MHKRGQFWYMDFIVGLLIIISVSLIFVAVTKEISINQYNANQLINTGVEISNVFMSNGDEMDKWAETPPRGRIGLVTDYKIDMRKLAKFEELIESSLETGYKKSKYLLGIREDYVMYFEYLYVDSEDPQQTRTIKRSRIYGKPNVDPDQIEYQNIRIVRYVYYDPPEEEIGGQIARMVVVVWRE